MQTTSTERLRSRWTMPPAADAKLTAVSTSSVQTRLASESWQRAVVRYASEPPNQLTSSVSRRTTTVRDSTKMLICLKLAVGSDSRRLRRKVGVIAFPTALGSAPWLHAAQVLRENGVAKLRRGNPRPKTGRLESGAN